MATKSATAIKQTKSHQAHSTDRDYDLLLQRMHEGFAKVTSDPATKLFTTDAAGLFDAFLAKLPAGKARQHYTCHTCRRFVDDFGGLVTIAEDGRKEAALWRFLPSKTFVDSVEAIRKIIAKAKVTGVFLAGTAPWGTPVTGEWSHIHVVPAKHMLVAERKLTAGQQMAEKREEYGMLRHGLADFPRPIVEKAAALLDTDALYRSEKCLGVAKWLLALHVAMDDAKGPSRDNIAWRAVASAPAGWCHVRSSMIGTLLEDLAAGMDFDAVSKRFAEKMHPLQYQRPSAPPSLGNIEAAEKLFAKLGLAPALERRFATLDDIKAIWTPPKIVEGKAKSGGIFDHLKNTPDRGKDLEVPAKKITWEKFRAEVLPTAERIDYRVPSRASFITLVTATNPDAPPILQWDHEDERNPVSWYVYASMFGGGIDSYKYGLRPGDTVEVTAVTLMPPHWSEKHKHPNQGNGAIFVLKGAVDNDQSCLGLFPECLRSELHEVRSTIEAHSLQGKLTGAENASACGIDIRAFNQTFRVKQAGSSIAVNYLIDRWG